MRDATTKGKEHTMAVMGGVGALSGDARGQVGARRGVNTIDRIGALSGVAYIVLGNVGAALISGSSDGAESPGQQILDEQQRYAENPWTNVAFAALVLAQMALMMFVGYLCTRVRDAGWLATTALIGGTVAFIANLVSISIVVDLFVLRDDLSPELARALQDLDGAGHLVQLLPIGVFVLFASAAALVTRALGRVLSWVGIAVGATCIVVFAASGLPANDEFFLWPFLLVMVWVAVISLRFGFARSRTATPAAVAATDG